MTSRDDLIEEAAKAMYSPTLWPVTAEGLKERYRSQARVALAVFEQAHAPTNDERCCDHPKCPGASLCCCQGRPDVADVAEEPEWEYGWHTGSTVSLIGRRDQVEEWLAVRGWKLGEGDWGSRVMRRRVAGPWEPVEQEPGPE